MKSIGFTGTRKGMTSIQREIVRSLVESEAPKMAHHGDCLGADAEFNEICADIGIPTWLHPCNIDSQRAFCQRGVRYIEQAKPPLDRNHDIVDKSDMVIATPGTQHEIPRSGTWATIRYARKSKGKNLVIVLPDGETLTK